MAELLRLAAVLALISGLTTPVDAQYLQRTRPDSAVHVEREPPLTSEIVTAQLLGATGGAFAGAFVGFLPLALRGFGGQETNETVMVVAVIGGFYLGSAVGVKWISRRMGIDGSWKSTLIGGAIGVLGGPAVLVTMPIGSVIGFNRSRRPLGS